MGVQDRLTDISKTLRQGARILANRGSKYNFIIPDFNLKEFASTCKEAADVLARVGKAAKVLEPMVEVKPNEVIVPITVHPMVLPDKEMQ